MPAPQEFHLLNILWNFDEALVESYLEKLKQFKNAESSTQLPKLNWENDLDGLPLFFRVEMSTPLHFILSHPLSRFSKKKDYPVRRGDQILCLKLGFVPAFCLTLNSFTIIKPWNKGATNLFSPTSDFLTEENAYWEMPPVTRGLGPQYSSLNFVLKQSSEPRFAAKQYGEIMDNYFKYLFWSFPKRGFSCSPHIIHGLEYVSTVFKVSKSIYAIGDMFERDVGIGFNKWRGSLVHLVGLTKREGKFAITDTEAVLTWDVAEQLQNSKAEGCFINAVVSEFRRQSGGFHTVTAVAELGYADVDLMKSIIGIVVADRFVASDSLAFVGSFEDVRREAEAILSELWLAGRLTTHTIGDGFKNLFEIAFRDLYPMVLENEGKVFFLHPYLFSCLTEFDMFGRLQRIDKGLIQMLILLENMKLGSMDHRKLPQSRFLEEQRLQMTMVERALFPSISGINFSRIVNRIF